MTKETNQLRPFFSSELFERMRCFTPLKGRILLDRRGCGEGFSRGGSAETACKLVGSGMALARLGLWHQAVLQWARALELDPTNSDASNNLAVAHELEGDRAQAAVEFRRALELEGSNIYILHNYHLSRNISET